FASATEEFLSHLFGQDGLIEGVGRFVENLGKVFNIIRDIVKEIREKLFGGAPSGTGPFGTPGGGLYGYASGGMHPGGWRVVGEMGPELEFTGPSRIMSTARTRGMLAAAMDTSGISQGGADSQARAQLRVLQAGFTGMFERQDLTNERLAEV